MPEKEKRYAYGEEAQVEGSRKRRAAAEGKKKYGIEPIRTLIEKLVKDKGPKEARAFLIDAYADDPERKEQAISILNKIRASKGRDIAEHAQSSRADEEKMYPKLHAKRVAKMGKDYEPPLLVGNWKRVAKEQHRKNRAY